MIDFTEQKNKLQQEQEAAEAWEANLRERAVKQPETLTLEEIDCLNDLNESFVGDYIDEDAKARFEQLCDLAHGIIQESKYAQTLTVQEPEQTSRHASVYLDMDFVMVLRDLPLTLFKGMVELADDLSIAYSDDNGNIRLTFTVWNVWRKK